MFENIVYKIDENGERISENWTGRFYENASVDEVWIYINDNDGKSVSLKKGDRIHYSDMDLPKNANYEIVQAESGIYRLRKI